MSDEEYSVWDERALAAALLAGAAVVADAPVIVGAAPATATLGAIALLTLRGASRRRALGEPDFTIALTVPGTLLYRQLVLRVVESSCKLLRSRGGTREVSSRAAFDDEVVSAFSEAFNNVVIHGYAERAGDVRIEIAPDDRGITLRMYDTGRTFEPERVSKPQLAELPESGMGLYIMYSFMDAVSYQPGDPPDVPNVLCLRKQLEENSR